MVALCCQKFYGVRQLQRDPIPKGASALVISCKIRLGIEHVTAVVYESRIAQILAYSI